MFVQYSFVHPPRQPAMVSDRLPVAASPSLIVAIGIAAMAVTTCLFVAA